MCACKFRSGPAPILVTQGFSTIISGSQFASGKTYEVFMFKRCVSRAKFQDKLATIKLDENTTLADKVITNEDVEKLSRYSDSGEDQVRWGVKIKDLLNQIVFTQDELDKSQCEVAFSND